jgi:H+/Cl- antiporter ClcA
MFLATVASVIGSVLADALLVVIGEAVFPGTRGYVHFRFSDYTKLTLIGVIIACVAWPVVARLSSAPRWLYSRRAGPGRQLPAPLPEIVPTVIVGS